MSNLMSLPDEVITIILQKLPIRDRMTSCCPVNKRLHAAAVAATVEIHISKSHRVESGLQWMRHYGQHVTRLTLRDFSQPLQQLPCPALQDLDIADGSVQLGPGVDRYAGIARTCTNLTRLVLYCDIIDNWGHSKGAVLDCLSSLVHLQHLKVQPHKALSTWSSVGGLSEATLPCLAPKLTYLHIDSLSTANLLQLSVLTNLQELCLPPPSDDMGLLLGPVYLGPSSLPGLVLPESLTKLVLLCEIEAAMLSLVPTGLKVLDMGAVDGPVEGPGSLLSYMAGLQHLTKLGIDQNYDWPPAGPAYSALTASSSLVSLGLSHYTLTAGIWPHVFPSTRKLLQLTCLEFTDEWNEFDLPSAWGAVDVSSLVSCCPNLRKLGDLFMQQGAHVSELHKLTDLTRLSVTYGTAEVTSFQQSFQGLASLTQVQDMCIMLESRELSMGALLPLTRLTALTALLCCCWPVYGGRASFDFQVEPGPDVWLQLLERCAAEANCHPSVLRSLAQQLAEQRALTKQQQQQLAEQGVLILQQQQQLADQQRQLAADKELVAEQQWQIGQQHLKIAVHEHKLSVQREASAQQDARISALEGQLQLLLQRHPL